MSSYKQEMREPEPSKHPDERMHLTIKHPSLRIPATLVEVNGKLGKSVTIAEPESPKKTV